MQLKEYVEDILVGALQSTSLSKAILPHIENLNPASLPETSTYPKLLGNLVGVINRGLTQIYSDLPIAEGELFLDLQSGMTRYELSKKHAVFSGADYPDTKYIADSEYEPFKDDIIECLYVRDELNLPLPTNNTQDPTSVFFPTPNKIQVPFAVTGLTLSVVYRAGHPKIPFSVSNNINAEGLTTGYVVPDFEIQLPTFLVNALTLYIQSKYHSAIGSVEAMAQSQSFYAEYLNIIQGVKSNQLVHGDFTETEQLVGQGWP